MAPLLIVANCSTTDWNHVFFFRQNEIFRCLSQHLLFLDILPPKMLRAHNFNFSQLLLGLWFVMSTQNVHLNSQNKVKTYLQAFGYAFLSKTHIFTCFFKFKKMYIFSKFLFDNIFNNIHCILNTFRNSKNIA